MLRNITEKVLQTKGEATMTFKRLTSALVAALALALSGGVAMAQAPPADVAGAYVPDDDYYILVFNQGMCLDVPDGDTSPNIFIQLFPLRHGENQLWRVRRQPDGFYQITNVH